MEYLVQLLSYLIESTTEMSGCKGGGENNRQHGPGVCVSDWYR